LRAGAIGPDQTTVVVLTGSGLKAAERVGALLGIEASP
jgi:threonine synthase